jgi:hypothetical protein
MEMNDQEALNELIHLWHQNLESKPRREQEARLKQLLADPDLVEHFTRWQAEFSSAEPETSLGPAEWKKVDKAVARGFQRWAAPWWMKPGLWLAAASVAAVAGVGYYHHGNNQPAPSVEKTERVAEESAGFRVMPQPAEDESRPEAPKAVPATKPLPRMAAHASVRLSAPPAARPEAAQTGRKISVVVEREASGSVSVIVKNDEGQAVRTLYAGDLKAGKWSFDWDGKDDAGQVAKAGSYTIEVLSAQGLQSKEVELGTRP